jgi:hypothetical protein
MVTCIVRTVRAMMKLKSHWVAAPIATFRARRRAVGISLEVHVRTVCCVRKGVNIPDENPAHRTPAELEEYSPEIDQDNSEVSEPGDLLVCQ